LPIEQEINPEANPIPVVDNTKKGKKSKYIYLKLLKDIKYVSVLALNIFQK
jgi:hypothetical protein